MGTLGAWVGHLVGHPGTRLAKRGDTDVCRDVDRLEMTAIVTRLRAG
jgi:hypothetical protein